MRGTDCHEKRGQRYAFAHPTLSYIEPVASVGWVEQRDTHRLDYIVGYRYAPPNLHNLRRFFISFADMFLTPLFG